MKRVLSLPFVLALCACGGGSTPPAVTNDCAPACLTALTSSCTAPSGACVRDKTTFSTCYDNGVKKLISKDASGATTVRTTKADGTTCFMETTSAAINGRATLTVKDASGATAVTVTFDVATGATTFTCGGASYTCDHAPMSTGGGADGGTCTLGTCQ